MTKEFRAAIENKLLHLNLDYEFDDANNPSAQVVYIRPYGIKVVVLQSALEDNPLNSVVNVLTAQPRVWWLQEIEVLINAKLEIRAR